MTNQLLPCPFCGADIDDLEADTIHIDATMNQSVVRCLTCGAAGPFGFGREFLDAKADAIKKWNTRKQVESNAEKIIDRLVVRYIADGAAIAEACDEVIDTTGNLLGWLRTEARMRSALNQSTAWRVRHSLKDSIEPGRSKNQRRQRD